MNFMKWFPVFEVNVEQNYYKAGFKNNDFSQKVNNVWLSGMYEIFKPFYMYLDHFIFES